MIVCHFLNLAQTSHFPGNQVFPIVLAAAWRGGCRGNALPLKRRRSCCCHADPSGVDAFNKRFPPRLEKPSHSVGAMEISHISKGFPPLCDCFLQIFNTFGHLPRKWGRSVCRGRTTWPWNPPPPACHRPRPGCCWSHPIEVWEMKVITYFLLFAFCSPGCCHCRVKPFHFHCEHDSYWLTKKQNSHLNHSSLTGTHFISLYCITYCTYSR